MKKVIALVCMSFLSLSYMAAEGYQVNSQSAKQAGMGHVGAALKLGAESMHFNPAGLAFMDKTIDLSAGVFGVFSKAEYSKDNYKHKADNSPSTPLYAYAGFKIYDFLAAGVSINNPYGSSMNWGVNWAGSSLIQDIALKAFAIQPTVSFKIGDRLSLGAGMMVMFGNFSLSRALVPAGGLEALRPLVTAVPQLAPFGETLDKLKDVPAASATLEGNSGIKLGYNIGAMFDVNERITVGVSYRSKVSMRVSEGHATMDYANENELTRMVTAINPILIANKQKPIIIPPLDKGTFGAELPLPSNLNVGISYKPIDRLMLSGEVQFVGWGAYKELNVQFSQEVLEGYSINAKKDYKNSRIYRIGGEYATTDRLDLRLGFYFDESPVKDDSLNPETPSMNKLGTTVGLSFRPLEKLSIDVALSYVTGFGRDGSYTDQLSGATFGGHYEVSAFTPAIGLAYSF
ncbi:MAG: outer membrane protein transport protein [Tannerellaceae bacterium]|jgi:long-chain fatty acid transport protein|nr:outer membrane protein transport protein [Tannerellaceae bacterium]